MGQTLILIAHIVLGQFGWFEAPATPASGDVIYTPTNGAHWTDPDPADAAEGLDDIAARMSTAEGLLVSDPAGIADGWVLTADGANGYAWGANAGGGGDLLAANNLSDLADSATARTNLGLGALAVGATAADAPYTPADGAHWTDPDPDDAAEGLDDLAARMTTADGRLVSDPTGVADGWVLTADGANGYAWEAAAGGGGLANIVEDASPQLGGLLDTNGNSIGSAAGADVDIDPDGAGRLTVQADVYTTGSVEFEGATADAHETTFTAADPTADRTITLPDVTGTVLTTGNLDDLPTMATVVAYYAGAGDATDTTLSGSSTTAIIYDTEVTDTGADYDHTTGVFTAPATAVYGYAGSLNHSGNTVVRVGVQKNTGGGWVDHAYGSDADQQPDGNTGVVTGYISLSSGDQLRFVGQNKYATTGRLRGTAYGSGQNVTHMSIRQLR